MESSKQDEKSGKFSLWRKLSSGSLSDFRISARNGLSNSLHNNLRNGNKRYDIQSQNNFQNCASVDDALKSLYNPNESDNLLNLAKLISTDPELNELPPPLYDWILDGEDEDEDENDSGLDDNEKVDHEVKNSISTQNNDRTQFSTVNKSEEKMNELLNKMELEIAPTNSTTDDGWGDFVSAHEDGEASCSIENGNKNCRSNVPLHVMSTNDNETGLIPQGNNISDQKISSTIIENGKRTNTYNFGNLTDNECNIHTEKEKCNQHEEISLSSSQSAFNDSYSNRSLKTLLEKLPLPVSATNEGRFIRRIMLEGTMNEKDLDQDEDEDAHKNIPTEIRSDNENDSIDSDDEWWQRTEQRIEMDLPHGYFTEDYDPIPKLLDSLPDNNLLADEYLTQKLSEMDVTQKRIVKKLTRGIEKKYDLIMKGMKEAQDYDVEVAKAHMYATKARNHLKSARKGSQVDASCEVIKLIQYRENLDLLSEIFQTCQHLLDEERDILGTKIGKKNFASIIKRAFELRHRVIQDPILNAFTCFQELRERSRNILNGLNEMIQTIWVSEFVKDCCWYGRGFMTDQYKYIQKARLLVRENMISDPDSPGILSPSEMFSDCVVLTIKMEGLRCFGSALLPTIPSHLNVELLRSEIEFCTIKDIGTLQELINTVLGYAEVDLYAFENLCASLIEILLVQHHIIKWHESNDEITESGTMNEAYQWGNHDEGRKENEINVKSNDLHLIGKYLSRSQKSIWNYCSELLSLFLDNYLTRNQEKAEWFSELNSLRGALNIFDTFLIINEYICGKECVDNDLPEKFRQVLRRYLRKLHVKAMNEIGEMLSRESWFLMEIPTGRGEMKEELENVIQQFTPFIFNESVTDEAETELASYLKRFDIHKSPNRFQFFFDDNKEIKTQNIEQYNSCSRHESEKLLYSCLEALYDKDNFRIPITTHASLQGLCKWSARLLTVLIKLPILSSDATVIFSNMYDLYILTSMRLCVGNACNENIILDGYDVSDQFLQSLTPKSRTQDNSFKRNGKKFFSPSKDRRNFSSKKKSDKKVIASIPTVEANICSPLLSESESASFLVQFVRTGQSSLSGIVNFDKVETWISESKEGETAISLYQKRSAASQSCIFVAALLDSVYSLFSQSIFNKRGNSKLQNGSLYEYRMSVIKAIPILVSKSTLMASVRVIQGQKIVSEILKIDSKWEALELHEQSNTYVEDLCDRCSNIWYEMSKPSNKSKLPDQVLDSTWESIVVAGFLCLLEGFSKVISCSTEGRALMSMDLATYSSEMKRDSILNRIKANFNDAPKFENEATTALPAKINPSRGMQYVDAYVKTFYFDKKGTIDWINENFTEYHLSHCLALASSVMGRRSGQNSKLEMANMIEEIQMLYLQHQP